MRKCGAIILAAGKGTRMKSERAKVVYEMAEKPLVRRVVETAMGVNCELLGVVVGYRKNDVMNALPTDDRIKFIEQTEQKGTGHAVMVANEFFRDFAGDVFILCGDVPLLSQKTLNRLLDIHRENKSACTVLTANLDDPGFYGRIIRSETGNIERIVEFKDASEEEKRVKEFNTGIYCFDSKLLFSSLDQVGNSNNQGEYYLTDTLEILNKMNKKVMGVVTDDLDEVTGINSQKELASLEANLYQKIKEHWLTNGVSIENPNSVIIGEDVEIENDVQIGANVIIKGKSRIGAMSKIGANSVIQDAIISNSCTLKGMNAVVNSTLSTNTLLNFTEKRINE